MPTPEKKQELTLVALIEYKVPADYVNLEALLEQMRELGEARVVQMRVEGQAHDPAR